MLAASTYSCVGCSSGRNRLQLGTWKASAVCHRQLGSTLSSTRLESIMKIYKNLLIIKETYLFYGSCWATDFVDNVFAEGGAMDSLSISSTLIFNDFFEIS
jgi:hypothetical protein